MISKSSSVFAKRGFIRITFTILTAEESLSRELEGRSPPPTSASRRSPR